MRRIIFEEPYRLPPVLLPTQLPYYCGRAGWYSHSPSEGKHEASGRRGLSEPEDAEGPSEQASCGQIEELSDPIQLLREHQADRLISEPTTTVSLSYSDTLYRENLT